MGKRAVIAIGGNSLILSKDKQTIPDQYEAALETARHIAGMIEAGYEVVVTHGNGPQVGFILRRSELARHEVHDIPLDYCGANSQGEIGYMIQQALGNVLQERGIDKRVVTVVTQAVVDRADPAFDKPSKPIGSFITDPDEAERRRKVDGWTLVEDAGRGWRRVVASPLPQEIVEKEAIQALLDSGFVVIAVGGGGIPVIRDEAGKLEGIAAVIDKDFASALLAVELAADLFVISTAVEQVALNFNRPDQQNLALLSLDEAKRYLGEGHFAAGSMGPKIKAVVNFLEQGGKEALITCPEAIARALEGQTGTRVVKEPAAV